MIFAVSEDQEKMILLLDENDLQILRQGNTLFVDERQLKGDFTFKAAILGYSKTREEGVQMLSQAKGYREAIRAPEAKPNAGEGTCTGCHGCIANPLLYQGRCINCWAAEAKRLRAMSN